MNSLRPRICLLLAAIFMVSMFGWSGCSLKSLQKTPGRKVYNLGKATVFDFNYTIPRTLRKYNFEVLNDYDTGGYRTIETEWKHRYPLEDEQQAGVIEAKTRLFLRSRKTSDNFEYVRMEVENMVRTEESGVLFYAAMTDMIQEEIDRMVDELKDEFAESRLRR